MPLTSDHIDRVKIWHHSAWQDQAWAEATRQRMQKREQVAREILALLERFLTDQISLTEFKTTFDKRSRTDWATFGLKAASGAMFLNMLVNHLPASAGLAAHLQKALRVPADESGGLAQMSAFVAYLNDSLARFQLPPRKLQPGRTPFFLSAFWHLQSREIWPIYYDSARRVLADLGALTEPRDPVTDYFHFRTIWQQLRNALSLSPWDLELLCVRQAQPAHVAPTLPPRQPPPDSPDPVAPDESADTNEHSEIQWLLAELGQKLGCKIWIAANDHKRTWKGRRLGEFSLPALPNLGIGDAAQKVIQLIDVLWLRGGKQVVAAFEVESTTSVYSGLLRISDLVTECPNLNIRCYIAVPRDREDLVARQLSRPTFQQLDLNSTCGFFSFEKLRQELPAIMKYANDPKVIDDLASFVSNCSE